MSEFPPPPAAARPCKRLRWVAFALPTAFVFLPLAGVGLLAASFAPSRLTPVLVQEVEDATGRPLTLSGPVSLNLSLTPTLVAQGVSLANPPGYSDADFLTINRVEAKIALLPLFTRRLEIINLVLVGPQLSLERRADGTADWDFSASANGAPRRPAHYEVKLKAVEVRDGSVIIHSTGNPAPITLALPHIVGTADSLDSPLDLQADATLDGTPLTLTGFTGPIERFSTTGSSPWPISLTLTGAGASASLNGDIDQPRTGRGYNLSLNATVPALEALSPRFPAIHNIQVSAQLIDQGGVFPAVEGLSLACGTADLSALLPRLNLTAAVVTMPSLVQPAQVSAQGQLGTAPLTLQASLGAPGALLPSSLQASTPVQSLPVSATVHLGQAQATLAGAIATPATLSGAALALSVAIPDLGALGTATGLTLPAWKNIAVQTTIIDPGGQGLGNAVGLDSLTASMDNASLGGDASLYWSPQPRLDLSLTVDQANLDALLPTLPAVPTVLPTWPLPVTLLKADSADIALAANALTWRHATYSALQAHAVLSGGVLTLSPVNGQLPGGSFTASAQIDASQDPAAETLHVAAPALALAPTLVLFGQASTQASGIVQARLDATARGDTLADMASSLNGQAGVASVNDIVPSAVLQPLVPQTKLPATLALRCGALRLDATNGAGTLSALTLASAPLTLSDTGAISFNPAKATLTPAPATDPNTDICPAALTLARLGQPGPAAPAPMPTATAPAASASGAPKNLLNSLLVP